MEFTVFVQRPFAAVVFLSICVCGLNTRDSIQGIQRLVDFDSSTQRHTSNLKLDDIIRPTSNSAVVDEHSLHIDVCESSSKFEKITSGTNEYAQDIEVYPDTWIYVTRCRSTGRPCLFGNSKTLCRPKKSWVQVYGKTEGSFTWRPHWIAVNSSCACVMKI